MKKLGWWILTALMLGACHNTPQTGQAGTPAKPQTETKDLTQDASVLQYHMIKLENLSVPEAAKLFKDYLEEQGLYYPKFVDFEHAANLDNVKFDMRPTVLVIYGHPKEMGKLINENQEVAYELPFRILLYRDAEGNRWLMYRDFQSIKKQYVLTDSHKIVDKYAALLQGFEKRLHEVQIKRRHEKTE